MEIALYILVTTFVGLLIAAGILGWREWTKDKLARLNNNSHAKSSPPSTLETAVEIKHPIIAQLYEQYSSILVGQQHVFVGLMGCWLAGGHALLTGMPGTGKTLAVKTFVQLMGLNMGRVQGTSDLLPADIVGSLIYNPKTNEFDTVFGPVMHECVLVDEINRMPSKSQSALLQAMAEHTITIGQTQYNLPDHFTVFATQNPHDRVGTFPLPQAQLDRFMAEIIVEQGDQQMQAQILGRDDSSGRSLQSRKLRHAEIVSLQSKYNNIAIPQSIIDHVSQIIESSKIDPSYSSPLSSRAGQHIIAFARAIALIQDKKLVSEDDIIVSLDYVLLHRLIKYQ